MKIQFFYTTGHTFTANNVVSYGEHESIPDLMVYETHTFNGDVEVIAHHQVPMFDLMFAVVTPQYGELPYEGGDIYTTVIIHGRADKFDIAVHAKQMAEIIGEAQVEAQEDEDHLNWKAHELVKYRARQKQRQQEKMERLAEEDDRSAEQKANDEFIESANIAAKIVLPRASE